MIGAGFSEEYLHNFTMVFWNLQSNFYGKNNAGNKFETYGNIPNIFYFSGFDGSIISFITDRIKTMQEVFLKAIDQECINKIIL